MLERLVQQASHPTERRTDVKSQDTSSLKDQGSATWDTDCASESSSEAQRLRSEVRRLRFADLERASDSSADAQRLRSEARQLRFRE